MSGLAATVQFEKHLFRYAGSTVRLAQLVLYNVSTRNSSFDRSKYRAVSYSQKTSFVRLTLNVYFYCPSHSFQIFTAQRSSVISAPVIFFLSFFLSFLLLLLLLLLLPLPLLLQGAELPLVVESFGLLNDLFSFPSILDAGYPVFNLHLANILFNVILPSVLGSSL